MVLESFELIKFLEIDNVDVDLTDVDDSRG